jgi:hypothetical protein
MPRPGPPCQKIPSGPRDLKESTAGGSTGLVIVRAALLQKYRTQLKIEYNSDQNDSGTIHVAATIGRKAHDPARHFHY